MGRTHSLLLQILSSGMISFSIVAHAGEKALVIVDMQDAFATRYHNEGKGDNPEILTSLAQKQRQMIAIAKQKNMPIMIVEYKNFGKTNAQTLAAIGDYKKTVTVIKNRDGLMDDDQSREIARKKLKEWGTTEMIVMGANGGACVERTIAGALNSGYKVWAYRDGIADLNYSKFISPYSYNLRSFSEFDSAKIVDDISFNEIKDPQQAVNFRKMPRSQKTLHQQAAYDRAVALHPEYGNSGIMFPQRAPLPTAVIAPQSSTSVDDPIQRNLLYGEPAPFRPAAVVQ